jgi:pimeloyl-ACP methyl ester carboxylesterase
MVELKCTPASEARVFSDVWLACEDAFARLGSIACPVTVACGSERALGGSFVAPEAEAPRIAAHLPNGRFEK